MITAIFPLRIYVEDTDFSGVVFHANYLKYFERARTEWANELGFGADWQREQKIYFAVRYAHLEYLKPARLNDKVEVVSKLNSFRYASMIYEQYLRLAGSDDTILCKAEIKLACVNHQFQTSGLPDELRTILTRLLPETTA